jgi:hypothetical protein
MSVSYALRLIAGPGVALSEIPPLTVEQRTLENWFSNASGNEIRLQRRPIDAYSGPAPPAVNPWTLQQIASDFIAGNAPGKVEEIGLVFCRRWANAIGGDLYGVMFDYDGHDAVIGKTTSYNSISREVAAVFLDALQGEDQEQIAKIACHELGHVFNLHHRASGFMASGLGHTPGFTGHDCYALGCAGRGEAPYAKRHLPGGDPFNPNGPASRAGADGHTDADWAFTASLPAAEYVLGQPVVLELKLRYKGARRVSIPATLDPGFPDMRIWYETPEGERRLYRPCLSYCHGRQYHKTMNRSDTLANNPRIHIGAPGLTFIQPGAYRVTVTYQLRIGRRRCTLQAYAGEIRIRRPKREELIASALACRPRVAFFLAHKGGILSSFEQRTLKALLQSNPGSVIARHARYALASRTASSSSWRKAEAYARGLHMDEPSLQEGLVQLRRHIKRKLQD